MPKKKVASQRKKKAVKYAAGGKSTCRGMGAATQGGRYRKDG